MKHGLWFVVALFMLAGCGPTIPNAAAPLSALTAAKHDSESWKHAAMTAAERADEADRAKLKADQAASDAAIAAAAAHADAAKAEAKARVAPLQSALHWIDGICVLVACVSVALLVLSFVYTIPIGRTLTVGTLLASLAVLVFALVADVALDHVTFMCWTVGVLAVVAVADLLWKHRSAVRVASEALTTGTQALDMLKVVGHDTQAAAIKTNAIKRQIELGIWPTINAALKRAGG